MCVEDRISNFSDHILCHILSFLPIKEAVRTSIISTKWRNLFASISIIEFDGDLLGRLTDRNIDSFKNFVDGLLKFPDQVSLDCFRLRDGISSWNDGDHDFDVSGWICAALCRGVKEIDLRLRNFGNVPPVLFTCHSLVNLTLDAVGSKIEVPSDVCLGNLKTFYLIESVVVCDSINRLISNCHVLEDLAFLDCSFGNASELNIQSPLLKELTLSYFNPIDIDHVVVINAPNLVYFYYELEIVKVYPLSDMKSLEKAEICILFGSETDASYLIQGICNVRSLTLKITKEIFPTSRLPIFYNLNELEFCGDICSVKFLHCVPNLKKLILKYLNYAGTQWKGLCIEIPSCLSFHLKEIEIEIPRIDTHMIEMVSYLLDNAMVLERLIIISTNRLTTTTEKRKVRNQLLQLLKSSKKCLIVIL
ncbi:hypothetical protein ES332_D09G284400v1 [Gossypium tomentosum]|uniref:F-box domain-containing protein n=1 Tax=Gossypium tomentosum TaxID=34277 RepID=A0A5D2JNQ5_GOSTO|nr:hypothetical protein ES332_D09G284400v1 [Gossypium tomentosum]